jgi:hypothetical protein
MCSNYNKRVIDELKFTSYESILFKSLEDYYSNNKKNLDILNDIIEGTNIISRRTIEYFVTNYSLDNVITYDIKYNNLPKPINVYISYKEQLKAHKKRYFDPFGRGTRVPFFIGNICLITTIGQLNFYRWFFTNKIYDYCSNNYDTIQKSLLNRKKSYEKKKKKYQIKPIYTDYVQTKKLAIGESFTVSFSI